MTALTKPNQKNAGSGALSKGLQWKVGSIILPGCVVVELMKKSVGQYSLVLINEDLFTAVNADQQTDNVRRTPFRASFIYRKTDKRELKCGLPVRTHISVTAACIDFLHTGHWLVNLRKIYHHEYIILTMKLHLALHTLDINIVNY